MYKAILFDMDGVLIDSEGVMAQSTIQALATFGIRTTEEDYFFRFIYEFLEFFHLVFHIFTFYPLLKIIYAEKSIRQIGFLLFFIVFTLKKYLCIKKSHSDGSII